MWVSLEKDMCPSAMLQSVLCSWQALLESSITDNLKAHVMRNKWKGSELHLTEIYKLPSIPFSDNFYQHEGYLSHFGFTLFLCPCRSRKIGMEGLVTQACLTLCDAPMDCSLPGSSVHGISQTRILQWVAIPFSRGSSLLRHHTRMAGIFFTVWATRGKSSIPQVWGLPGGAGVKNVPVNAGDMRQGFDSWVGKIPWSRKW